MDFKEFTAGKDDEGRRLDKVLKGILPENSTNIFQLLRKGLIKVNGKKADASQKVNENDVIKVATFIFLEQPEAPETDTENQHVKAETKKSSISFQKLERIFQNEHLLIINKPYNISCQPSSGEIDLSTMIQKEFSGNGTSLSFKPGALHRLDRNTTGLLCFSQSNQGAQWFTKNIKNHSIRKTYIGLAQGKMLHTQQWKEGIENEGERDKNFYKVKVNKWFKNDTVAITTATPLIRGKVNGRDVTLIQYNIETGRKHQIRAQSAFHGFPLLGDTVYGGRKIEEAAFFLHAVCLEFPENELGVPSKLECPLSDNFKSFLKTNLINWNGQLIIK